ncbi:hypothetical protein FKX85_16035 [Echinicola soli]|uniref:Uncharacterized protein n=1 Tax=Echinicola soli TaxID=2591634 RepID=A0A514CKZ9_9BACT|nr:hypothetical protein [Echinicola soli]QDH80468.1 hypothetical protein FKX85_16035 [Echinicola soli]
MKNLLLTVVVFLSFQFLEAKEVCWCAFEVISENGKYLASIRPADDNEVNPGWKNDWKIQVYELIEDSRKLLWESAYTYSGKATGILSNDGQFFTYVENWYNKENPIVHIYKNGHQVHSPINGKSLDIPRRKLKKGELHYYWLTETGNPYAYEVDATGDSFLVINAIDGQQFKVDLKHGTFKEES